MAQPDVHDLINFWMDTHGWPVHEGIKIGPAKCGIRRETKAGPRMCRAKHAYARTYSIGDDVIVWTYERPCDINAPMGADRAKP